MSVQYITRKGTFDSGHRVMNEKMKCFNIHGHTYLYDLKFSFDQMKEIGYPIDFKEIKRVACQWIDDTLDHGMILNPKDLVLISCTKGLESKLWTMSLNGLDYCNPTVENIAKEIFLAMRILFKGYVSIDIHQITLYETPNCFTDCFSESISVEEEMKFNKYRGLQISSYATVKGVMDYDDRNE
jgi:6-pyruvoyltetrahydropterin/6-carboxytetrahydropterin synthase